MQIWDPDRKGELTPGAQSDHSTQKNLPNGSVPLFLKVSGIFEGSGQLPRDKLQSILSHSNYPFQEVREKERLAGNRGGSRSFGIVRQGEKKSRLERDKKFRDREWEEKGTGGYSKN